MNQDKTRVLKKRAIEKINQVKFYFKERKEEYIYLTFFLLILSTVTIYLYRKYLFGSDLYVFRDIASDSFQQTLPNLLGLASKIEQYGKIPTWDASMFLGGSISSSINILDSTPILFGKENVPYLMGFFQAVKVVLAGCLFYWFCRISKFSYCTCYIASFCYAYCGHMIVRGAWASYPGEVILAAFLLVAFELYYQKGNVIALPFAFFFLFYTKGIYYFILYTAIFITYVFFRYFREDKFKIISFIKEIRNLFVLWLIGICLSAKSLFISIESFFQSARVGESAKDVATEGFNNFLKLSNKDTLISCYLKTFSHDIFGGAKESNGLLNFLDEPTFYCGILLIIMLPYAFLYRSKKKKIMNAIMLGFCLIYCIFEYLRFISNGFSGETFKMASFWITLVIIFLGTEGLETFLVGKPRVRLLPVIWIIALIIPIGIGISNEYPRLNIQAAHLVVLFIIHYLLIIIFYSSGNKKVFMKNLIFCIVLVEIILISDGSINNRVNITDETYREVYDNGIGDTVKILKKDDNDLFRVDYPNTKMLCQPKAQEYMGTSGYVGGMSFDKSLMEFMGAIGNSDFEINGFSRYMYGFNGMNEINTMLGIKYLIYSKTDDWKARYIPFGYQPIKIKEDLETIVYENKYALPFVYTYNNVIREKEFLSYSKEARRKILLQAMVVPENVELNHIANVELDDRVGNQLLNHQIDMLFDEKKQQYDLRINNKNDSEYILIKGNIEAEENEYYYIDLTFKWAGNNEEFTKDKSMRYVTLVGKEDIVVPIKADNVENFRIHISPAYSKFIDCSLSNFQIYEIGEDYFENYKKSVSDRKREQIKIIEYSEDSIGVELNSKENQYVFFPIPYDQNWVASIDGKPCEIVKSNISFMSVEVERGEHTIKLEHLSTENKQANICTAIGIMLFLILISHRYVYKKIV